MIDRFAVRKTDEGYGVWDAAVNGWRSRQDLGAPEAAKLAETMNSEQAARDKPSDGGSRRLLPPKPVIVLVDGRWWSGRLDWWVHETDGWYGRATVDATGTTSWYPASALRPATDADPADSPPAGERQPSPDTRR